MYYLNECMAQKIEISWKTIVFTVFFLIGLMILWQIRELLFALFLAFIFMSSLKPFVNRLERSKFSRPIAAATVFFGAILILIFLLAFVLPPIITQSIDFITNLPALFSSTFPLVAKYLNINSALQFIPGITQNVFKVASGVFSNFLFLISVFFFTFYFLLEEKFLNSLLMKFLDKKDVEEVQSVITKVERRLGAWMRGELILMTIIGVFTYIGLSILGVRYALSLAFIAGFLEIIPIIGPIVSAIPAFLVAMSTSLFMGGGVTVMYLIIQQLENNIIVPYVMNKAVGINPIFTLIALSVGGTLGGLLGAVLAVPVALVAETIFMEFFKRQK